MSSDGRRDQIGVAVGVRTELFAIRGASVSFGGVRALQDVSLTVDEGQAHGLIGPNGAGKTTVFNVACGFVSPERGELTWRGEPMGVLAPHRLAARRIARTLQGLGLFDRMPVVDNVMVGADRHARAGFWSALIGAGRGPREEAALRERAMATLEELGIADHAASYPGSLPYPVRKKVALARALVAEPELLLLDEPASGLSADEMAELGELVRGLRERMSVLLVEHHMDLVMSVCDRVTVLDFGRVIASGPPAAVQQDPAVLKAYLGEAVEGPNGTGST